MGEDARRLIPAVGSLLADPGVKEAARGYPQLLVSRVLGELAARLREELERGEQVADPAAWIRGRLPAALRGARFPLRRVYNATGVVLHTNLGRAPLAPSALEAVTAAATGYCNLEFDLEAGERGTRYVHAVGLLRLLTGAEDALVVNNNAAAVLLCLAALARDREVVVSRGELVEIGGGFRIPEVMAQSGAHLVEVGTTNRTRRGDYERAIGPQTALLLKVHRSNFRMEGFVSEVEWPELVELGRSRGIPVMFDLGSGCLFDLAGEGVGDEPVVPRVVARGGDLVTFSGDKLLGGPQAGIIVGRAELVARLRSHPLLRAMRVDKMTLAALSATLALYLEPDPAANIPVLASLRADPDRLRRRAERLRRLIRRRLLPGAPGELRVVPARSTPGGGSLPGVELPGYAVAVCSPRGASRLAEALRGAAVPVLGRVQGEQVLLDVRTLADGELPGVADQVAAVLNAEVSQWSTSSLTNRR
ncbi:MAG: L-seryl-tRNA(Sec) selenium transferase [Bacillota bacterium]|nr:L-seryl-tRNA(Sec) selenium transferase [Bacillota bacterium]